MKMRFFKKRSGLTSINWLGPSSALLFLLPWILGATECNLFSGAANKTSDSALMYTAQQQINTGDYADALTTIASISTTTLATRAGLLLEANANAGLCGLNLLNLATGVSGMSASSTIMSLMLSNMKSATSYSYCKSAETEILAIGAAMTTDDYVFLAFVELAKIGAILETSPSAADPTHSGTVSASFNPCVSSASGISDVEVEEIGVSMDIAYRAITSSGLSIASTLTGAMSTICTPKGVINCSGTTDASMAPYVSILRTVINTSDIGLNVCGGTFTQAYNGSKPSCACP